MELSASPFSSPARCWLILMLLCMVSSVFGQDGSGTYTFNVTVGSEVQTRTAYIYVPPEPMTAPVPVVFVFHGHGGTSESALASFHVNTLWPEAISVYMQGLPTVSNNDPNGLRSGWQSFVGTDGDRDLLFFDQVMASLTKLYPIDPSRIYCTGISNGGYFTTLLWQQRGTIFAAYAPCSSARSQNFILTLKPAPAILQGGDDDDVVSTQSQVDTMRYVYALNQCTNSDGWYGADAGADPVPQAHASNTNDPLVTWLFHGGHELVQPYEADQIVTFFKTLTGLPLPFFNGEAVLSDGVYYLQFPNGNVFGYYSYLTDPRYIYHFDLGYEYIFDANDGKAGVYFYDFTSGHFFYTSPTFPFPYLYDFTLNAVLYYFPDPNNLQRYNTDGVRYFYNFATGRIITQ